MSDDPSTSTVGEADNDIYFTLEQFAIGLLFPVPSLVKQFLHFTLAPPIHVHPNVFQILTGCNVNSILVGNLTGGDLFHLHFEAWDWEMLFHIGP